MMYFKVWDRGRRILGTLKAFDVDSKRILMKDRYGETWIPMFRSYVLRYTGMKDSALVWIYDRDIILKDGKGYIVWYRVSSGQYVFSKRPFDDAEPFFTFADVKQSDVLVIGSAACDRELVRKYVQTDVVSDANDFKKKVMPNLNDTEL